MPVARPPRVAAAAVNSWSFVVAGCMKWVAVVFVSLTHIDDVFTALAVKAFPNTSYIQVDM